MSGLGQSASKGAAIFRLLFPTAILRKMMAVLFVIVCAAFALAVMSASVVAAIVAAIAAIKLVLFCVITIPTQMIALASSRTAIFLAQVRSWLLIFLWVFSLGVSLAICWVWDLTELKYYSPVMLLSVWLMTSVLLQASVWLCCRWPGIHIFLFAFYFMLNDVMRWLELWNPLLLALALLLSWIVFAGWWINWRPQKYKVNPFLIGAAAHQKNALAQYGKSWFQAGAAKSWQGSRLLGAADGWGARGRRILSVVVYTPLGFIPAFFLMGDAQFKALVPSILLISSGIVFLGVLASHALNLRSIWLCHLGGRDEFYALLQKKFWVDVLPHTLLFIVAAFSLNWLWGVQQGTDAWLYFLLSVLLLQLLGFHMHWWIYQRTASIFWCNMVSLVFALCWLLMSFATGFLAQLHFGWQDLSPLWIVIPELILLVLLLKPVRSGFSCMNFAGGSR